MRGYGRDDATVLIMVCPGTPPQGILRSAVRAAWYLPKINCRTTVLVIKLFHTDKPAHPI